MERKEEAKYTEIDLSVIFQIIKKNILPMILAALLFGAGAYLATDNLMAKQYRASSKLIVNNKKGDSEKSVNNSEIAAAQMLASTYSVIIKSNSVLQPVIDKMQLNMTYEQLEKSITVSTVSNTQIIEISMKSTDPNFAKKVVENVVKVAQPVIMDVVEAGSVKVVDEARLANNGNPVGPNALRNAFIGAFAGLLFVLVIVIIKEFFNKRFKSENDITNTLGLPLIGMIPHVSRKDFEK